jgi:hypothetical protein
MKNNTRKKRESKLCVVFDIDETILIYLNTAESSRRFAAESSRRFAAESSRRFAAESSRRFADESSHRFADKSSHRFADKSSRRFAAQEQLDYAEIELNNGSTRVVLFRPGFKNFIQYAKQHRISIAIWTYGDRNYANFIERIICEHYGFRKSPFVFVYSSAEIYEDVDKGMNEKDLRRIFAAFPGQFTPSNTFLVDNKPSNIYHETNMHNGFIVQSFNPFLNAKYDIDAILQDRIFEILRKICDKIVKKKRESNTPIFGNENVQLMDLEKYYRKYVKDDKTISVLSTDSIDYDQNFTLIQ